MKGILDRSYDIGDLGNLPAPLTRDIQVPGIRTRVGLRQAGV